jgi:type IV pilus assembly protein PilO
MADNFFTKLSLAGQLGLSGLLAAVILGAFWWFYWSPAQEEYKAKTTQLEALRTEIRALEVTASKLQEFQREVALLEAKLETLKRILPPEKETPDLMRKVQSLAAQSNLVIRKFTPGATVSKEFYQEWPINVEVDGSYHNLGYFFDRVRRLSRLVNIGTVNVKSRNDQTVSNTVAAACVATTFVYVETPPGGPPGPSEAGRSGPMSTPSLHRAQGVSPSEPPTPRKRRESMTPTPSLHRAQAGIRKLLPAGLGLALLAAFGATAFAQAPAPPAEAASPADVQNPVDQELQADPTGYNYNPQGRRDPFVSLLKPVSADQGVKTRRPGMEGFLIQEVALKGIVRTPRGYTAMLLGTDGKSYFVQEGQRMFDGVVTKIDATAVTFRQEITDPLSTVKSRDVRKTLYPSEEARQ